MSPSGSASRLDYLAAASLAAASRDCATPLPGSGSGHRRRYPARGLAHCVATGPALATLTDIDTHDLYRRFRTD